MMNTSPPLRIDVWSDYVCPFCYLQLPALERLHDEQGAALSLVWHAFELRPEPIPTLDPDGDYLHRIWESSVYPMARERGLTLRLPPLQPRSRKAQEAAAFAREYGHFDAMHAAIFRAFFEDGQDIGDTDVLLELGRAAGLPVHLLREALDEQRYQLPVLEDEQIARNFSLSGVPLMLLRRADAPWRHAVPLVGAVPYEQLTQALAAMRDAELAFKIPLPGSS